MRETIDHLRDEVEELRASRKRLVLAADVERGRIERALHEGVQQILVALAVNLQLVRPLFGSDPDGAQVLVDEIARDVQHALDETARLADSIDSPFLDAGRLGVTLRSAAARAAIPASVDVAPGLSLAPEVARTVYRCWLEALDQADLEASASVAIREEEEAVVFEVFGAFPEASLDRLRDRVEALGGELTTLLEDGCGIRVSGSLPVSR